MASVLPSRIAAALVALGVAPVFATAAQVVEHASTLAPAARAQTAQANWPPIIDMHAHWQPNVATSTMLRSMEASTVQMAVIMPNQGYSSDAAEQLQQQHPGRFIAFIGFQNRGWVRQEAGFLDQVEAALRTRQFKGMGEVLLRHFAIPERSVPDISIAADSPSSINVLELAAKFQVPVILHLETETAPAHTAQQLANALDEVRRRGLEPIVIWAHAGGTSPAASPQLVDSFLAKYPNLYIDISSRSLVYRRTTPITDPQGVLLAEWRVLLIKYRDRVFAGSDTAFADLWERGVYVHAIRAQRDILRQLPNDVAEQIAFQNARRLLKLK